MTPKQKELLVRALLTDRYFLSGGEYGTAASLYYRRWSTDPWSMGRTYVTPDGLKALEHACQPIEILRIGHGDLLLIKGQPVAKVLPGQRKTLENLLADTGL
ncbi:MAG: hypothetical protein EOR34_10280 [Mesorhizobium sp.]|uniref:hypothetical protein n=1 Tax=Mesorhizobium sp. TaxID=1871066 RepID=UPI000FE76410|nr:hypothetical protein [Mesorhizobium sp.]RWI47590.1 MAG: hypothetical protein EOR15_14010 [Mesorhizobium sp.]RWI88224.1 MAG: hypothetical protein EOR20_04065 [Mesorhizobium sp.]RWJ56815.1 MAG: hypothetical protein EOR32_33245 [Mesorhizobium sp.]RWJ74268.1 MAG: hypothetical protein EOR34_10280 [Mesorhizobium sp.]